MVAVILALGITATIILLAVETILHSGTISTQEASLLSTVLGAAIGAVATYLGLSKGDELRTDGNESKEMPPPADEHYPPEA